MKFLPSLKIITVLTLPLLLGAGCSFTPERIVQDGGIWVSNDNAENWEQKIFVNEGKTSDDSSDDVLLDTTSINFLRFHPLDSRILYANTPNGLYFTENAGESWQLIYPEGVLNDLGPSPQSRGTLYAARTNTIIKTEDNGGTWTQIYVDSRPGVQINQIAIDPLEPSIIYIGTSVGDLIVSYDAGSSWQVVEGFDTATDAGRLRSFPITKIVVNPRDVGQIYVATQAQGLWASFDRGESWQALTDGYQEYVGAIEYRDLVFDETRDGALLYASAYGLLWSFDGGLSWTPIELLTPPNTITIKALALNPNNPDQIYYSNERVLYKTFDGGINWIAQNLPSQRVATSLLVDFFNGNKIYLGVEAPPKQKRGLIGF